MTDEEYRSKIEEVLSKPLSVDDPTELYKEITLVESLSYFAIKKQANEEYSISAAQKEIDDRKAEESARIDKLNPKMRMADKEIILAAELSVLEDAKRKHEAVFRYYKNIQRAIESKIGLAQSILSNMSASIKAGMLYENVK